MDVQFRFFGVNTYEVYYQAYKSYFLKNSAEFDASYANRSDKIIRPDIKTQNLGFNYYRSWREDDYSQAIAFDQLAPLTESGWGVSWVAHGSSSSLKGSTPFIPVPNANTFGALADLKKITQSTLAGGMAVGGMLAYEHVYLTGFLALGLGYQKFKAQFASLGSKESDSVGAYTSSRLGLGYNGKKHVTGAQFITDQVSTSLSGGNISGQSFELKIFYAYRFDGVDLPLVNSLLEKKN